MTPLVEDRDPNGSAILIVDDVESNLTALESALAPLERPLVKARSGADALAELLRQDFAVVLLDLSMPVMDGYETARWMRSIQRTRDLPIIFLTAHDKHEGVTQAYKLGLVDFLFKPLDNEILRAKTQVFIALHERTQELARLHARRLLDEQRAEFLKREVHVEQRAKAQLAHVNEQLALADRRKTEFLATLAHELRNPLAPLRSVVDVLREAPDAITPGKVIEVLDRQLTRVTRLVDDMLDISRIVAGKLSLRLELLELGTIIEHALTESRAAIKERGQKLSVVPPDAMIPVRGDALRLVQVVVNLLTNAARYTMPGGAIEVTWGARDGTAFVRVTDNGIGIRSDVIDSLFEMFAQEGVAREHGGLGLGLPIAKRLIELHGGTIHASSPGRDLGSAFEVLLPVSTYAGPTLAPPAGGASTRIARKRVLVVDDNDDARDLMAAILTAHGHDVVTAHDGPSGLAALCTAPHDVALLDLGLPGFDGIELVRRARECRPDLATRLVAMTGYGQDDDRQRTAIAGFDAHLVKPVSSAEVLGIIDAAGIAERAPS